MDAAIKVQYLDATSPLSGSHPRIPLKMPAQEVHSIDSLHFPAYSLTVGDGFVGLTGTVEHVGMWPNHQDGLPAPVSLPPLHEMVFTDSPPPRLPTMSRNYCNTDSELKHPCPNKFLTLSPKIPSVMYLTSCLLK